jgi:hypothetical protein
VFRAHPRLPPLGRDEAREERASVVAVKGLLGHKRLSTTQQYVATSLEDVRRAIELLDDGGKIRSRS